MLVETESRERAKTILPIILDKIAEQNLELPDAARLLTVCMAYVIVNTTKREGDDRTAAMIMARAVCEDLIDDVQSQWEG